MTSYFLMFGSAFIAATLLPLSSEITLAGFLAAHISPLGLWIAATAGNTLGAVINWALGRYCLRFSDRRWFPFKPHQQQKMQPWFQKYGKWCLLLSWLPVVGDGLTFIAGTMNTRLITLIILAGTGKGARYLVIIWLYLSANAVIQ